MSFRVWGGFVLGCFVLACRNTPAAGEPPTAAPAEATALSTPGASDAGDSPACLTEGAGWTPYGEPSSGGAEAAGPDCCPGLVKLELYDEHLLETGKCIPSRGGRLVCTRCGNGRCEAGESRCNCTADCP